jgi:hypothetical protein
MMRSHSRRRAELTHQQSYWTEPVMCHNLKPQFETYTARLEQDKEVVVCPGQRELSEGCLRERELLSMRRRESCASKRGKRSRELSLHYPYIQELSSDILAYSEAYG